MMDSDDDDLMKGAIAFAKTLKEKSLAEKIGLLMLAFDMDLVSAKALVMLEAP